MTDADTLTVAFFRAEFKIPLGQAMTLLALYQARRPLAPPEVAERAGLHEPSVKAELSRLRDALGEDYVVTRRDESARGRPGVHALTLHGRLEIDRMLRGAVAELSARLGLGLARAA